MIRRPPRSTRTDTLFPDTTLFRSILGCRGPRAALRPAPGELGLLTDASLVLPPQLYRRSSREAPPDLRQAGSEAFFKSAMSSPFCPRSEDRRVGQECVRTCRSRWSPDH